MTDYTLTVQISSVGLDTLRRSGENVALVQNFVFPPALPLVWFATAPTSSLSIQWSDTSYVYSSSISGPRVGATVPVASKLQALPRNVYQFEGGQFSQVAGSSGPGEYQIKNLSDADVTAGLARIVTNPTSTSPLPLTAETIPGNMSASYSPTQQLQVVAIGAPSSTVISPSFLGGKALRRAASIQSSAASTHAIVFSPPLTIDFGDTNALTIHWDDNNSQFAVGPLPT